MPTIAAIATARGRAALAIVRLSGPEAIAVADSCLAGGSLQEAPSHTVHFRRFRGVKGTVLDEVVVTLFRAPRSSTGEDVVEIACHGGDVAPQLVLETLLDRGARLAEPGEFTRRAFLNGKMDLAQAEAVADLIHASSTLAHRVSMAHLQGRYSETIREVRAQLVQVAALVELELDFSEEDVEFADRSSLRRLLADTDRLLDELLGSYRLGTLIRDGVVVVIGGRPNAGKSTLLNALVGRDRAIVSEIPGTTRDEIEAEAEIGGLRFRFVDTAGLRETSDLIEAEGVRRTRRAIAACDVLLYVYDVTHGLEDNEREFLDHTARDHPELPVILVANKEDLRIRSEGPRVRGSGERSEGPNVRRSEGPTPQLLNSSTPQLLLSAREALRHLDELTTLRALLVDTVRRGVADSDGSHVVMNQRHRAHLARAREAVQRASVGVERESGDTLALDLRLALDELGAITGEITTEDILGEIFGRFCIGK